MEYSILQYNTKLNCTLNYHQLTIVNYDSKTNCILKLTKKKIVHLILPKSIKNSNCNYSMNYPPPT